MCTKSVYDLGQVGYVIVGFCLIARLQTKLLQRFTSNSHTEVGSSSDTELF